MTLPKTEAESRQLVQRILLLAAVVALYPLLILDEFLPDWGYFAAERYMAVPCMLFLGSALTQRLTPLAKKNLLLSLMMVFWFLAVQMQHQLVGMGTRNFGIFAGVYLLAFPFAAVTEDRQSRGLLWVGRIYAGFSVFLSVLAVLLLVDLVPQVLTPFVFLDGARAHLFWHPNGAGCILMVGIGMSLYLLTCSDKKWEKYLLAGLILLQFFALVLTNSRTTILMVCCLIGGTVFFALWKGQGRQLLVLGAAAVVLMGALVLVYSGLQGLHTQAQIEKLLEEAGIQASELTGEVVVGTQKLVRDPETGEIVIRGFGPSGQNSFFQDIFTFNGRTGIWSAACQVLRDIPETRIWGTENYAIEVSYRLGWNAVNTHNSWVQTMIQLGIPGLLLSLVFTALAIWNLWILMWNPRIHLSKKVIALLVICILGASFLEAYLFVGEMPTSFNNYLFFLCTGYLMYWNVQAKAEA